MRRGSQAKPRIHIPAVQHANKGLGSEERIPEQRRLSDGNDLRRSDDRNVPQKRTIERTMIKFWVIGRGYGSSLYCR